MTTKQHIENYNVKNSYADSPFIYGSYNILIGEMFFCPSERVEDPDPVMVDDISIELYRKFEGRPGEFELPLGIPHSGGDIINYARFLFPNYRPISCGYTDKNFFVHFRLSL